MYNINGAGIYLRVFKVAKLFSTGSGVLEASCEASLAPIVFARPLSTMKLVNLRWNLLLWWIFLMESDAEATSEVGIS